MTTDAAPTATRAGPSAPGLAATAVVATVVFLALALAVAIRWTPLVGGVDTPLEDAVHRAARAHAAWPAVATVLSDLGSPVSMDVVAVVTVIVLLVLRRWRAAVAVAVARLVELGIETAVKDLVARHRPRWPDPLAHAGGFSFPSGHSAGSAVMGVVVVLVLGTAARRVRTAVAAVVTVLVVGVAASRVVLGVHYLSDVVAGVALGVAVATAVWAVAFPAGLIAGPPAGAPANSHPAPHPDPHPDRGEDDP